MRPIHVAIAAALALTPAAAFAQAAAPAAPAAHYSVSTSTIGDLLDDPAAKAVVVKHMPGVIDTDQIDMARGMTLKDLQQYAPDKVTDKALAETDAELSKLPAKK